jgi:hypothetical protein
MERKKWLFVLLIILMAASLACNLNLGGPEPPASPIPVSTEEVEKLQQSLEQAYTEGVAGSDVTIEITEAQMTSMAAFELQGQESMDIQDPQVFLRDGQIQFFATVEQPNWEAVLKLVLTLDVDTAGNPEFSFVSAKIGPLDVPDSILEDIELYVDRAFASQIDQRASDIRVESITIEDGVMTIKGQKE